MNEWITSWELELLPIVGLIAVLVVKEVVRAYSWPGSSRWFKPLNLAIAVLTPTVMVIFALRLMYIVNSQ